MNVKVVEPYGPWEGVGLAQCEHNKPEFDAATYLEITFRNEEGGAREVAQPELILSVDGTDYRIAGKFKVRPAEGVDEADRIVIPANSEWTVIARFHGRLEIAEECGTKSSVALAFRASEGDSERAQSIKTGVPVSWAAAREEPTADEFPALVENALSHYPYIKKYLGGWLDQLVALAKASAEEYVVLVSELINEQDHAVHLKLLDHHLELAEQAATESDLNALFGELKTLSKTPKDANETVLNKLAELRAIVGLSRNGYTNIRFAEHPDLTAEKNGQAVAVDVVRASTPDGKREDVWDELDKLDDQSAVGVMFADGKWQQKLRDDIYRRMELKQKQLGKYRTGAQGMVWISMGRDYLTAGAYEVPGVGLSRLLKGASKALSESVGDAVLESGDVLFKDVHWVVLSRGRDEPDEFLQR